MMKESHGRFILDMRSLQDGIQLGGSANGNEDTLPGWGCFQYCRPRHRDLRYEIQHLERHLAAI